MNETQLHVDKAARRGELEAIITAGLSTVFKVGTALAEIRDANLYQPEFESFEAYCVARWAFKRAHAYRYIEAATLVTEMSPIGDITRESHARALLTVPAEQRAEVFRAALAKATSEGRVLTAKDLTGVAKPGVAGAVKVVSPVSKAEQLQELWTQLSPADRLEFLNWAKLQMPSPTPPNEPAPAELEPKFVCNGCGAEFETDEDSVPLYECGDCGSQFTTETSANGKHQCPDCYKFGSKVSNCGCPECNDGALEANR